MLLVLALLGCNAPVVSSEQPLISESKARLAPELVGTWRDDQAHLSFSVDIADQGMGLRMQQSGEDWGDRQPLWVGPIKGQLYTQLHLDKLNNAGDYTLPPSGLWWPVRLEPTGDHLTVYVMQPDWFWARQGQDLGLVVTLPGTVTTVSQDGEAHQMGPDVILRSPSKTLRRWVRKHRDEGGLFQPEIELRRTSGQPAR